MHTNLWQDGELAQAGATVLSLVASLGTGYLLARIVGLESDLVVLAAWLGLTWGRMLRHYSWADWGVGVVVAPATAVFAAEVEHLVGGRFIAIGLLLFVLAMSTTVWVRQWGLRAGRAGGVAVAPLLSVLLITHTAGIDNSHLGWTALIAETIFLIVCTIHLITRRHRQTRVRSPRARSPEVGRISTRMAVQLGIALAGASLAGLLLLGGYWRWAVLTAFIICSGNRGRADVLYKGLLRIGGAGLGTIAATGLLASVGHGTPLSSATIFMMITLGTLLRPLSYAYWAGCITIALGLLLGDMGASAPELLEVRLLGILLGGGIAAAVSWFVLPIKSTRVARRRVMAAKTAHDDLVRSLRAQPDAIEESTLRFLGAVEQVDQIAAPFRAQRRLVNLWRRKSHAADAFDTLDRSADVIRDTWPSEGNADEVADTLEQLAQQN